MSENTVSAFETYEEVRAWEIESHQRMLKKCRHAEGESRVYCILNLEGNAVKIGTTKNVRKRFQQLQTASPDKLYLHEHIRGGRFKERELHCRYARFRRIGEWFHDPSNEIAGEFARFSMDEVIEDITKLRRGVA